MPKKKMPGRPFQHILETSSRSALSAALPQEWLLEPREHDYGIDLDIEIFEDGYATGLRIAVQLKGQQNSGSPARVKLRRSSISYWKESDSPVIVVIWDEKTDTLWWEWQYLLDTHKSKNTAVSVSVVIPRRWDSATPSEILREARAHRAAVRGEYETPLPLQVITHEDLQGDQVITRLTVAKVRRFLLARPEVVLAKGTEPGQLILEIRRTQVSIRLLGTAGVILHFLRPTPKDGPARDEFVKYIVDDILSSVATLSGAIGLRDMTDYLLGQVAERTQLLLSERGLARSLGQLAQAGNNEAFTTLFVRAIQSDDYTLRGIAWQSLVFFTEVMPANKKKAFINQIENALPRGDDYSRALYTLAQNIKDDDSAKALELFHAAAVEDPAYKERPYWWSDVGVIHFNAARYDEAIIHYEKAVALGEESTMFLLADAYLMSGRMGDGLDTFHQAAESGLEEISEWKMKKLSFEALRGVLHESYPDFVVDPEMIPDISLGLDVEFGPNPLQDVVDMLNQDYRQPDLLGALGLYLYGNAEVQSLVMVCFAFMSRGNPVAWTMALEAILDSDPELLQDMAVCAMQQCGDALLEYQAIEGGGSAAIHESLTGVIGPERPYIIRSVDTGRATFDVFKVR